jgi:hypothetical protein
MPVNKLIRTLKVGTKYLRVNPWKTKIMGTERDPEKLQWLGSSFERWDFNSGLVGRVVDSKGHLVRIDKDTVLKAEWRIQLANGGHRLDELIAMKWEDSVLVCLHNLSNVEMLQAMATDNRYTTFSPKERRGIVIEASKILTARPDLCETPVEKGKRDCKHGAPQCVSMFLGEKNWPVKRVFELLSQAESPNEGTEEPVSTTEENHAQNETTISPILDEVPTEVGGILESISTSQPEKEPELMTTTTLAEQVRQANKEDEEELKRREATSKQNGAELAPNGQKKPKALNGTSGRAAAFVKSLVGTATTYENKWTEFTKTFTDLTPQDLAMVKLELTKLANSFTAKAKEISG